MDNKGKSLRKKRGAGGTRPIIGAPTQIPMPPMPGARLNAPGATPQIRSQDRDKVAEMFKKRMSTRFFVPGEIAMPDMPDMDMGGMGGMGMGMGDPMGFPNPALQGRPGGGSPERARAQRPPGNRGPARQLIMPGLMEEPTGPVMPVVENETFEDPDFNPEYYIQTVLVNATDAEVQDFQQKLRDSKRRNSQDLQKNVFVNRTQFVLISKEIDKLKTEMRVLRGLLNDLQVTTNSLKLDNDTSGPGQITSSSDNFSVAKRKAANRSSIADLTALHMSHLQLLWKEVEGSQKFLPAIPGRHIIIESRNWVELNAATWKARRTVQMVLLNDHLLLAVLKKKRADPSTNARPRDDLPDLKLVAERCWPLADLEMVDLSPHEHDHRRAQKDAVSNALNIRVGKESFVFRSDEPDAKIKLLLAFKKAAEDLRKLLRAEAVDKHRLKDSLTYFTSRDPALLEQGELLQTLSANLSKDQPGLILHVDGKPRNLRWVEDQMDELDESIAHRDFDEGVRSIEKLRNLAKNLKGNLLAAELINLKLDERASRLAGIITEDLMENPAKKSSVKKFVNWLARLDFEDRAREAYLEARSAVIKKRTRQVLFLGDTPSYTSQLSLILFTLLRNTIDLFCACFEHRYTSTLIKWVRQHVANFADLLDRQLASVGEETKKGVLETVRGHGQLLVGVGVDLFKGEGLGVAGWGEGSLEVKKEGVGLGVRV